MKIKRINVKVSEKEKALFDQACIEEGLTPSTIIRKLMMEFVNSRMSTFK